jgi:hypothetical protein
MSSIERISQENQLLDPASGVTVGGQKSSIATRSSQKGAKKMVRMQVPGEDNLRHLGTEEDEDSIDENGEGGAARPKQMRQAALINQSDELD